MTDFSRPEAAGLETASEQDPQPKGTGDSIPSSSNEGQASLCPNRTHSRKALVTRRLHRQTPASAQPSEQDPQPKGTGDGGLTAARTSAPTMSEQDPQPKGTGD